MSPAPFASGGAALPELLPIFPLTGVLLLPRGKLPLNVFEPRYLAMTDWALGGARLIGMVQPQEGMGDAGDPPLYRTGCAGRITAFSETEDGRYLITLTGISRFDIAAEPPRGERPYRVVVPDWQSYRADLEDVAPLLDRARFVAALKPFFQRHAISVDWQAVETTPDDRLVTTIAMICPFAASEKQALLEARDPTARARLLTTLVEMAAHGHDDSGDRARH